MQPLTREELLAAWHTVHVAHCFSVEAALRADAANLKATLQLYEEAEDPQRLESIAPTVRRMVRVVEDLLRLEEPQ